MQHRGSEASAGNFSHSGTHGLVLHQQESVWRVSDQTRQGRDLEASHEPASPASWALGSTLGPSASVSP